MKKSILKLTFFLFFPFLLLAQQSEPFFASYHNLKAGGSVQPEQIEAINDYLRSALIASVVVDIRLTETDLAIHGKISDIDDSYLLVVQITDFAYDREVASYSEDFLSLSEFGFVVDSIVARIEGRSLIDSDSPEVTALELDQLETFELQDVELEKLQISEVEFLLSQVDVSDDPNSEKMAAVLNGNLVHCYVLFNEEHYENAMDETQKYLESFENMFDDAKIKFQDYRNKAKELYSHASERHELKTIRQEIIELAADQRPSHPLIVYERMESIIALLDRDWIDDAEVHKLKEDAVKTRDYFYIYNLHTQLSELNGITETGRYLEAFHSIDDAWNIYNRNYKSSLVEPVRKEAEELFTLSYQFLYEGYLAYGITSFNENVGNQYYDRAYREFQLVIDLLLNRDNHGYYEPDLIIQRDSLHQLWRSTGKLAGAQAKEFEFDMNYYAFQGDLSALRTTFDIYQEILLESVHIDEYYDLLVRYYNEKGSKYNLLLSEKDVDPKLAVSRIYFEYENALAVRLKEERDTLVKQQTLAKLTLSEQEGELNRLLGEKEKIQNKIKKRPGRKRSLLISTAVFSVASGVCLYPMFDKINTYNQANNTPDVIDAREQAEMWATFSAAGAGTAAGLGLLALSQSNAPLKERQKQNQLDIESVEQEIIESKATLAQIESQLARYQE